MTTNPFINGVTQPCDFPLHFLPVLLYRQQLFYICLLAILQQLLLIRYAHNPLFRYTAPFLLVPLAYLAYQLA